MKRLIAIVLCAFLLSCSYAEEAPSDTREISISFGALLARGYGSDDAQALVEKNQRGEALTPFVAPVYDDYNSPAEENGRGGDLLLLSGTITEYVKTGSSSEYVIGFRLLQDDGNEWVISCAQRYEGVLIGGKYDGSNKNTVFDDLLNKKVEVYAKYSGFSEKFKRPAADIIAYGGLFIPSEELFISTMTAGIQMRRNRIYDLGYLIGAKRYLESTEKYIYR